MNDLSSQSLASEENVRDEYQITLRLIDLEKKTKYSIIQENGQRRLTAPEINEQIRERVKGAEVFIGRLPRDCYEDELMPVLEKVGRLMELRLMLDFSGSTRGYAFALFKDTKTARRACEMLNEFEIRPGHKIGVVKSIDNCRLFFGGVPKSKTKIEFLEDLNGILDGIVDIHVYPNSKDRRLNRGFIFVEFKDHKSAAMARRRLIPGKVMLWDHEIAVDWADPEPGDPIDDDVMQTVTALFIRNLSMETTQQQLKEILQKATKIPIIKLKKINHFAFVHYETRKSAEQVMDILSKADSISVKNGWEIQWAKPVMTFKNSERQRCINEAISKNNRAIQTDQDKNSNQFSKNKRMELTSSAALLDQFVSEHLQGQCCFEIFQSTDPYGFACKITILRGVGIYFEHFGNLSQSTAEAIEFAAQTVFNILNYPLDNYSQRITSLPPSQLSSCNMNMIEMPGYYPQYPF